MTTGTAVATREPKAQLVAGAGVAAIIPRNIEETVRLSHALALSGMAPASLKTPEQIMVAIMAGAELGFPPFQALQSFAIVNNRPSLWGDAIPALLWSQGFTIEEWFDNEDAPTKAFCKVKRPKGAAEGTRSYSLEDAKRAGLIGKAGPWQTAQRRMLQMRARAFAARDIASDVLKGFQVREEVEDYQPMRDPSAPAPGTGMRQRLEARTPTGGFNAQQIETEIAGATAQTAEFEDVLAGDDVPAFDAHDPQTGEVDDFPGDRNTTSAAAPSEEAPASTGGAGGLTLDERVAAFKKRCEGVGTVKLQSLWRASSDLRTALDKAEPEEGIALEQWFNAAFDAAETREKGG